MKYAVLGDCKVSLDTFRFFGLEYADTIYGCGMKQTDKSVSLWAAFFDIRFISFDEDYYYMSLYEVIKKYCQIIDNSDIVIIFNDYTSEAIFYAISYCKKRSKHPHIVDISGLR